jgi:hypothetical protein
VERGRNPYRIDEWLQQVIEDHRPASKKSEMRVESAAHIRIGRTRGWIQRAHASVADRRDQHGKQCDQNDGDKVTVRKLLGHAVERYGAMGWMRTMP